MVINYTKEHYCHIQATLGAGATNNEYICHDGDWYECNSGRQCEEKYGYTCTYDAGTWQWRSPIPSENTGARCGDGRDNDCDGSTDCDDPGCQHSPESFCSDSCDNDNDGCTDGVDSDCGGTETSCVDGIDNDCDGCLNGVDSDCGGTETDCTDGIDNDCDGFMDCDDIDDCSGDPAC